jgi:hypothetical protein
VARQWLSRPLWRGLREEEGKEMENPTRERHFTFTGMQARCHGVLCALGVRHAAARLWRRSATARLKELNPTESRAPVTD